MRKNGLILIVFVLSASLFLAACQPADANGLKATGYLTAREVKVAPELAGKVIEVFTRAIAGGDVCCAWMMKCCSPKVRPRPRYCRGVGCGGNSGGIRPHRRDLASQGARLQVCKPPWHLGHAHAG